MFAPLAVTTLLVMGVIGITAGWHTRAQERPGPGWVITTGTVVGAHQESGRDGDVYGPIVSFTDASGVHHQFTAPTSSDKPSIGGPATVSYDPHNPAHAHDLSDSGTSWAAPFVTGIILISFAGLLVLFLSWYLIRQRRRRGRAIGAKPASPRAAAAGRWLPRLLTLPIAAVVYLGVESSSHRALTASIATVVYLIIATALFTLLAYQQRRRPPTPPG